MVTRAVVYLVDQGPFFFMPGPRSLCKHGFSSLADKACGLAHAKEQQVLSWILD